MAIPELVDRSPSPVEAPGNSEVALVGKEIVRPHPEIVIVSAAWGDEVTNTQIEDLARRVLPPDKLSEFVGKTLPNLGITVRHYSQPLLSVTRERGKIGEEVDSAGSQLLREALAEAGIQDVGLLLVGTTIPPDDEGRFGVRIAQKAGVSIPEDPRELARKVEFYHYACGTAGAGILDVLKSDFKGWVAFVTVDPLSHGNRYNIPSEDLADGEITERELISAAVFGNGVSVLVFHTDAIELYAGRTRIVPDKKGSIRAPRIIELPDSRLSLEEVRERFPHYDFEEGSEEVFAMTEGAKVLLVPASRDHPDRIEMEGGEAARFFYRNVVPLTVGTLAEYYQEVPDAYEHPVELCVPHQPSNGLLEFVIGGINERLKAAGLPQIEAPWVLDEIEQGNSSASTFFPTLGKIIQQELNGERQPVITAGKRFLILTFGVGMVATAAVIRFKLPA